MPAVVPVALGYGAAKGGMGGLGSSLTNTQTIRDPGMDQNAFNYGGSPDGAAIARERMEIGANRVGAENASSFYNQSRDQSMQARDLDLQARGEQQAGLNAYRDAMMGKGGPSVAELQMQRGLQNAQMASASTAASARGGGANLAAAQRMAANQQGQLAGQSNEQAAMLRANEIAQARQGYMGAANSLRGADQSLRSGDLSRGGQDMQNSLGRAQLQQGYEQMGQRVNESQLNANMAYQQANANNSLRAQEGMAKIGSENTQGNRQLLGGLIGGGSSAASMAGGTGSDENLKKDVQPAGESKIFGVQGGSTLSDGTQLYRSDIDTGPDGSKSPGLKSKASKMTPTGAMMSLGDGFKSMGTPFYTDYTNPHGGEMYGLNQTASDERLKDHVVGAKGIESTLDSLHPKSFEYKEPSVDGYGQRTGIMAQDLAKTPLGRQVIEETPRGMYLDNSKALSLALAANANLNDRLKKLESKGSK